MRKPKITRCPFRRYSIVIYHVYNKYAVRHISLSVLYSRARFSFEFFRKSFRDEKKKKIRKPYSVPSLLAVHARQTLYCIRLYIYVQWRRELVVMSRCALCTRCRPFYVNNSIVFQPKRTDLMAATVFGF